jgi:hypothetical protein
MTQVKTSKKKKTVLKTERIFFGFYLISEKLQVNAKNRESKLF